MDESTVFDRLVKNLDSSERQDLLKKLQKTADLDSKVLYQEAAPVSFDPEQEFQSLTFWQRLFLLLEILFTHKDRSTILEARLFRRLAAKIDQQCPGLIDASQSLFLGKMHEYLEKLNKSAAFFAQALSEILDKRAFFAFLARSELEIYEDKILEQTDPHKLWQEIAAHEEKEVWVAMLHRLDDILESFPAESKRPVTRDVRAFYALQSMSAHPFGTMLTCFRPGESGQPVCAFQDLKRDLTQLVERLFQVRYSPSAAALQNLFLFRYREELEEVDFNLTDVLQSDLNQSRVALAAIENINADIPLTLVVKLVSRNLDYSPESSGRGESWFNYYREFWRHKIETIYNSFFIEQQRESLGQDAVRFLGRIRLPELEVYRADLFARGVNPKHTLSLSFLTGFVESTFQNMYRSLKLILLRGEFYKEENRNVMTDSFNFISKIADKISELENRLKPGGDLHQQIDALGKEILKSRLRSIKLHSILKRADKEALFMVNETLKQLKNLIQVLAGILYGQPGAPFDTLLNLNTIGGLENKELIATWKTAMETIEKAYHLLSDIQALEVKE